MGYLVSLFLENIYQQDIPVLERACSVLSYLFSVSPFSSARGAARLRPRLRDYMRGCMVPSEGSSLVPSFFLFLLSLSIPPPCLLVSFMSEKAERGICFFKSALESICV